MFSKHVGKRLSAYCHGELAAEESRQIAEHLIGCQRCRAEYEEIKLGVKFADHLPVITAPDSLWDDLELLIDKQGADRKPQHVRTARMSWRPVFATIAVSLLLVVGLAVIWFYWQESRPTWEVARLDGAPRIGDATINNKSRLAVGEWLETDDVSRAKINVGTIGHVDVDPNTRIRLLETKITEHRLELARGRLSARIWAPPRLFFVDTPSAVAADLGCAYTLEVDDAGASLLRVTSGWVALQLRDRESMVPAGAACATRPGIGPGTPYFEDASEIFRKALAKLDFEPQDKEWSKIPSLDIVLAEARPKDTLTLWHLLSRVEGADRGLVYDRMAALAPPPAGVTREGILQLDGFMMSSWKAKLEDNWSNDSKLRKTWIGIWTRSLGKIKGAEKK
ncbi:MAG TPA: zf-HC2 domain-containing protein [Pyrinomonadaceae bacterium]|nr:zf-HC2 domain-containing protein [Pyrinomonadaceae bacterium]